MRNIHAQKNPNPGINTMYIPVGKLHPRSEFAGILINLNVADAIKRGKMALDLANTFRNNHVERQTVMLHQQSAMATSFWIYENITMDSHSRRNEESESEYNKMNNSEQGYE